jgi:hypothetical protein
MPTYRQKIQSSALAKPIQLEFAKPTEREGADQLAGCGLLQIGFTLDTSQSMDRLLEAAAAGYNAFVAEQREIGPAELTFNCFSSEIYPVHSALAIGQVPAIDRSFLASKSGATALLDGIGDVMKRVGVRFDELRNQGPRALIAILTDGMENSSDNFTPSDIFQMIHYRRTVHRWEFLFIAATEAGERYGLSLGIQKSNICRFETSVEGVRSLMRRLSLSVGAYQLGDKNFAGYLTDRTAS